MTVAGKGWKPDLSFGTGALIFAQHRTAFRQFTAAFGGSRSAPSEGGSRPSQRRGEVGKHRRQLLGVRRDDILQLACEHCIDGRPVTTSQFPKHIALIPRHARPQLDDLCGSHKPFISELERGVKVPSLTMILRLAEALDCRVYELVEVFDQSSYARKRGKS